MSEDELTQAARAAIDAVLQEHSAGLVDLPNAVLGGWVLVSTWQDLTSPDNKLSRVGSEHLLVHHRAGLLHEALYGDWSDDDDA